MSALRAIAERLLKDPPERKTDELLRELCRAKWCPSRACRRTARMGAGRNLVEALQKRPSTEPPSGSANIDPVRLLQKRCATRCPSSFRGDQRHPHAPATTNAKAIAAVYDEPTMEPCCGFPDDPRTGTASSRYGGGQIRRRSIAAVVAQGEPKLREAGAWVLTEMKGAGWRPPCARWPREWKRKNGLPSARLRQGQRRARGCLVFVKQSNTRRQGSALCPDCLAEGRRQRGRELVAEALSDPDESVRFAPAPVREYRLAAAKIVPQAIRLISHDARGARLRWCAQPSKWW